MDASSAGSLFRAPKGHPLSPRPLRIARMQGTIREIRLTTARPIQADPPQTRYDCRLFRPFAWRWGVTVIKFDVGQMFFKIRTIFTLIVYRCGLMQRN
ncbi:hypothetical protein XENTR_v10016137 [Xenopus tropicalis]|nr:hypothetical protein XENTR_v10016137 [Xenopus tropicalis]